MRLNPWTIRAADSPIGLAHDALDLRAGAHELLDLAQAAPQPKAPPDAQQTIRRESPLSNDLQVEAGLQTTSPSTQTPHDAVAPTSPATNTAGSNTTSYQ